MSQAETKRRADQFGKSAALRHGRQEEPRTLRNRSALLAHLPDSATLLNAQQQG
jgi:hypothetical protein